MKRMLCRVIPGSLQAKPHGPYDSAILCVSVYYRNLEGREEEEREGQREEGRKERKLLVSNKLSI